MKVFFKEIIWNSRTQGLGRLVLLIVVGLLACTALIRALVGLVEATVLLMLAFAVILIASPRNVKSYWRLACREIPVLVDKVVAAISSLAPAAQPAEQEAKSSACEKTAA